MGDTLDLLTLTEAYRAINDVTSADSGTGNYDARLAALITGISRRVDDLCGPVVQRTVSGEEHEGGCDRIYLRQRPVASVTTLVEYYGTSGQTLAAEDWPDNATAFDFRLVNDGMAGIVERRSVGYPRPFGWTRVIATYVAGRFASTAAVDAKFKLAAGSILRRLWEREAGRWAAGGDPFGETSTATGIGFFKAVDPMVSEFLGEEMIVKGWTAP